jgi:hypothetical protein
MVKCKPKDGDELRPRLVKCPPPSYCRKPKFQARAAGPEPIRIPPAEKRSAQQVIQGFKMLSRGWDSTVEASISVPSELFFSEGVATRFYSKDENPDLSSLVRGLGSGKVFLPNTDYGIVLYETTSTVYFVLFDAERRIVVREALFCHGGNPPERDWSKIRRSIDSAAASAATEDAVKKGQYAVYDGALKMVAPADVPPFDSKPPEKPPESAA